MRLLSVIVAGVLGVGFLSMGDVSSARADAPVVASSCAAATDAPHPVAARPGTSEEARDYERRESQSPEVQEFAGGDVVIGVSLGVVLLIILIIIILLND